MYVGGPIDREAEVEPKPWTIDAEAELLSTGWVMLHMPEGAKDPELRRIEGSE